MSRFSGLAAPRPLTVLGPLSNGLDRRGFAQVALAFFATATLYPALYGELPYHDVARFVGQVNSGRFVWDIAHIFMQPATLLWHRTLGFGETAEASQKHINTFATALAIAIFYALLLRLRVPAWQRVLASALVTLSCSIMILAPTGHMKLLAFPFVNAALYCAVAWEQARTDGYPAFHFLVAAAMLLALASAFLVSALATAPFATFAVLLATRRAGARWQIAVVRAAGFATVCGLVFMMCVAFGYLAFSDQPLTAHGLAASVSAKSELRPGGGSLAEALSRLVFGTVNNLIAAPLLGSVVRGWIAGFVPSLRPYSGALAAQFIPWLCTLALIGLIYLRAAQMALRGAACLMPIAFLCGAQAWAGWYQLNDPEHWFQLTVPTILLLLLLFPHSLVVPLLPIWSAAIAVVNLALIGIPEARYPLTRYEAQLSAMFSGRDMLIDSAAFPGGPYLGFFTLPNTPVLKLDQLYEADPHPARFFPALALRVDAVLAQGGRVVIFRLLDPGNWDAPWGALASHGLTKQMLAQFLDSRYTIRPLGDVAEMTASEILPRH